MMGTHRPMSRMAFAGGILVPGARVLPDEVAVALTYNGTTQAVMMATPANLEDFARGFTLTEGIARTDEIDSLTVLETLNGIDIQIWLKPAAEARLTARRRTMAGPVGCGLCGIDSLEEALRDVPVVTADLHLTPVQICAAVASLPHHQSLHDATRAAHAAAFWVPDHIVAAREDVGRHNALDKLIGAISNTNDRSGAIVLTSRVSIDLVQKVAMFGAPMMIAVSAPTAEAVTLADKAGITLIALARADRFEVFTHPHRVIATEAADVA
jgi:FdhD protein